MARKEFDKINVDARTSEFIRYTAKALHKPISTLLSELFAEIVATCLQFENGCNISYLRERNDVRVRFSGCSRTKTGSIKGIPNSFSDAECDELIAKELVKAESFGET